MTRVPFRHRMGNHARVDVIGPARAQRHVNSDHLGRVRPLGGDHQANRPGRDNCRITIAKSGSRLTFCRTSQPADCLQPY
jgi:hypothetical protein